MSYYYSKRTPTLHFQKDTFPHPLPRSYQTQSNGFLERVSNNAQIPTLKLF